MKYLFIIYYYERVTVFSSEPFSTLIAGLNRENQGSIGKILLPEAFCLSKALMDAVMEEG